LTQTRGEDTPHTTKKKKRKKKGKKKKTGELHTKKNAKNAMYKHLRRLVFLDVTSDHVRTRLALCLGLLCVLLSVANRTFTAFLVDPRTETGDSAAPTAVLRLRSAPAGTTAAGATIGAVLELT
jgi:hypothetical protein